MKQKSNEKRNDQSRGLTKDIRTAGSRLVGRIEVQDKSLRA